MKIFFSLKRECGNETKENHDVLQDEYGKGGSRVTVP